MYLKPNPFLNPEGFRKNDVKPQAELNKEAGRNTKTTSNVSNVMNVSFQLNGVTHNISDAEFGPSTSLAQYIREVALLTGTKISCNEGGCGSCIVTVKKSQDDTPRSLNSCLTPVMICDGWSITTVEGLGDRTNGYHPIQEKLAAEGGSQCGYCSPGMVMQLYSWLQEHPNATKLEIDNILDGNICRCTGYRPILDAFKSFASDQDTEWTMPDIEDLKLCKNTGKPCSGNNSCGGQSSCHSSKKTTKEAEWFSPTTIDELLSTIRGLGDQTKYLLVSGNTASGVYKNEGPYDVYISVNKVAELHQISVGTEVVLGGNVKITDAINNLANTGNEVFEGVANHMKKIASYGIRNQGSIAGNLMMKNAHNDFPSDVFLSLETAGAMADIMDVNGTLITIPVGEVPWTDMNRKIIVRIKIQLSTKSMKKDLGSLWSQKMPVAGKAAGVWKYRSFKIMPRSTNAHAYVNAGFLARVDPTMNYQILERPRLVFGGIATNFVHATNTENFLNGRNMNDHEMFLEAMTLLAEELVPEEDPVLASTEYRKQLALGLFYKFYLYVLGDSASEAVRSGALDLDRGLSSGQQDFETDESQWPVSQPMQKYEAKIQAAGEAEYVNDIPTIAGELHAAFVLSNTANCDIASVDTDAALAVKGVIAYIDASDIPGINDWKMNPVPEPVFCTGRSEYAGQSIGVIVAETRDIALKAAKLVKVTYTNLGKVIVDIEVAMQDPNMVTTVMPTVEYGDYDAAMAAADTIIEGRFRMGSQYHFHMETHVCIAKPTEDGMDLEVPSQDINATANVVAKVLNVSANSINLGVKRLGGAFGGKINLQNSVATAAAVAANKLRRPVRLWVPLEDNMCMLGKRNPYLFDYKIGFDSNRKIVAVKSDIYSEGGWNLNAADSFFAIMFGQSCYHLPSLRYTPYGVKTHVTAHTSVRAPGMCNGHAMLEHMLEHAAAEMNISALELRLNNLMMEGSPTLPPPTTLNVPCPIQDIVDQLKVSSDYNQRMENAAAFNKANKWKKRGVSLVPMRYPHHIKGWGIKYHCLISVFAEDATISVTHGGIEMGQGINTKVRQVVAKELGVDVGLVKIKATANITNPNGSTTGGSFGSELNCGAAIKACSVLNGRLQATRKKLGASASWNEIITEANTNNIDLCARAMICPDTDPKLDGYSVWGAVVNEVEVDILTGEMYIVRADLIEDAGLSTSPQVDVGQVEGAFVMGLGLWTSEQMKFHPTTGAVLTKNTWEYKPPAAKDIPQDFRVTLLKNARNPVGVLSSKATGEPALLMSVSVLFAIKDALNASRMDAGLAGWWKLDGPATVEKIHQHAGVSPHQFVF